ncbi:MAG: hypothetical protein ACREDK_01690 [Thermoplasmata archaeon]
MGSGSFASGATGASSERADRRRPTHTPPTSATETVELVDAFAASDTVRIAEEFPGVVYARSWVAPWAMSAPSAPFP